MFGLSEDHINQIVAIISSFQEVKKALIFGSRAIQTHKSGSDVDIAIILAEKNHEITNRISYFLNEETTMPYKFDIIDYQSISNVNLINHINNFGIAIFER